MPCSWQICSPCCASGGRSLSARPRKHVAPRIVTSLPRPFSALPGTAGAAVIGAVPAGGTVLSRPACSTAPRSLMVLLSRTAAASSKTAVVPRSTHCRNRRNGRRANAGVDEQRLSSGHRYRQGPCVGVEAVCIGRPYLDPRRIRLPVERVLEILRVETPTVMEQVGGLPHPKYCGKPRPGPCYRRSQSGDPASEGCYGPYRMRSMLSPVGLPP